MSPWFCVNVWKRARKRAKIMEIHETVTQRPGSIYYWNATLSWLFLYMLHYVQEWRSHWLLAMQTTSQMMSKIVLTRVFCQQKFGWESFSAAAIDLAFAEVFPLLSNCICSQGFPCSETLLDVKHCLQFEKMSKVGRFGQQWRRWWFLETTKRK